MILAEPRGFCAGAVRAIDIVERALEKYGPAVHMRHEIGHDTHVAGALQAKAARFVDELAQIPRGAPTIFSAHGVTRCVVEEAGARGLPVIDATCPLVAKVHFQARRYEAKGRWLILIGHAGHAEVVGLTAGASTPEVLVDEVIAALRRIGPVQTSALAGAVKQAAFRLPPELLDG